ncbi:MAG: bifunctional folylpolyglutamate synthase/dihydrofolate synthase [Flavobacteriaceae bacterium]
MNYSQTLDWLYARLPMYQRVGAPAMRLGLDNIVTLSQALGNPETQFKSIHVAGTNGKGSSSHMLASVLQTAGYKVGLYTSPHLKDFRERIRINGIPIPKNRVVDFVAQHQILFERGKYSFFELTVALAFSEFAHEKVDIAIVEVGLGGRLDATNIIKPALCLITNISKDHQQFLGDTLPEIASEKAGIIKPGVPVVVGENADEVLKVLIDKATDVGAPWVLAKTGQALATDLLGDYQKANVEGVITVISQLKDFEISQQQLEEGLRNVVKNTGLQGRWQVLAQKPLTIADVAHNGSGIEAVMRQLTSLPKKKLHIVFGMVADKDFSSIASFLPNTAVYYFCSPCVVRAKAVSQLTEEASLHGLNGEAYVSVEHALMSAQQNADIDDIIFVGGSVFTVAEVL